MGEVLGKRKVSIVAPFYNESDAIDRFYKEMCQVAAARQDVDFEFVCVDDGSSDDTLTKLISISSDDHRFRIVEFTRNFGKEPALTAGIDAATGDAVVPIDADLQDPPELISTMIDRWLEGAEVVLAQRVDRDSDTYLKRKTAAWFYSLHNKLAHTKIPENVGDFRLMDRVVVDALKRLPERQRFMKGLFAWVGYKPVIVTYARQERLHGKTKFSGWKLWNFALEGFTSFSTVPLKVWTYIGLVGALCTMAYALFIIVKTLFWGVDVPGYASLLVAVLFLGSVQLISIGILGEYLGRIYVETKQRPTYLVRKVHGDGDA